MTDNCNWQIHISFGRLAMAESYLQAVSEVELRAERFFELLDQEPPVRSYHYTDQSLHRPNRFFRHPKFRGTLGHEGSVHERCDGIRPRRRFGKEQARGEDQKNPPGDCCELLRTIIDGLSGIAHVNVCSVSFCENPDLLSQWRGILAPAGLRLGFALSI